MGQLRNHTPTPGRWGTAKRRLRAGLVQMEELRSIILTLISVFLLGKLPSITAANATDRLALLSFKSLISDDPSGSLASWSNDSLHFCRWQGVRCGNRHHPERVTALDLAAVGLVGSISPSLGNLTFLARIDLSQNSLVGEIPEALSSCSHLRFISLWGNNLGGEIPSNLSRRCPDLIDLDLSVNALVGVIPPDLGSLSKLEKLILYSNNLQGVIPPSLGNLSSLLLLDISMNILLAGGIPPSLGKLSNLHYLHLTENNLTGAIPPSIGALSSTVTLLDLSYNQLAGLIPPSIWNRSSSLTVLSVAGNQLHGTLPADMAGKGEDFPPRLKKLYMSENQFSGPIPASLSNASTLEDIELYANNFTGTIPESLGALQSLNILLLQSNHLEASEAIDWGFLAALTNCTHLIKLNLDRNLLGGKLPNTLGNLSTGLTSLTIARNQIYGNIHGEIGNLINLTRLHMNNNHLSGFIPASIGRLNRLSVLALSGNELSGSIPSTLGNLTQLTELYLGGDLLSGSIPAALGNCQSLTFLDFSQNQLTGVIPVEVIAISSLSRYLSFSGNSLSGPLPSEVGSLKNLNFLDISSNRLSGEIPSTLSECLTLEYLYMGGNLIRGAIPPSLSKLRGLQELDLSRNFFSGLIPEFLQNFTALHYLNLSFNEFDGQVPVDGVFANLSAISVVGNDKLCGGNPKLKLPPCEAAIKHKSNRALIRVLIISIASSLFVIFILCSFATAHWIRKSRNRSSPAAIMNYQHMIKVSYAELAKATDGFSPANLIGAGSFGSVYKGIIMDLDSTRNVIAVKVINLQEKLALKSFMAECEALRNIRHRNLLKILTLCSSVDFRGNDFKALVFNYMPNGSLEDWLHQGESKSLDFFRRLSIAIDVASALDYLHRLVQTPIVHCDLKPSNVLIDDDMTAHVADFGLARFITENVGKSSANPTSSIGLNGSIGYIPPEYGMGNKVSTGGDVYSYGILLLEMFTGKRPTDESFKEGLSLHNCVDLAVPDQVTDVADRSLFSSKEDEAVDDELRGRTHECLVSVLRIGLLCSKESPMERMQMGDVAKELLAIMDVFLGNGIHGETKVQLWTSD